MNAVKNLNSDNIALQSNQTSSQTITKNQRLNIFTI